MENFKQSKKFKAVTFSFDDGVTQDIRLIELLNRYGLKCTFNLNSELLGKSGILPYEQKISHYKISPEDVKYVYEGHEVAVHTLTHPNLTALDKNEIIRQTEEDRKNLEALVGYKVCGMAYPCGGVNNDDRVADIIKENTCIKYCRTITSTGSSEMQSNLYRFNPSFHILDWENLTEFSRDFIESAPDTPQILYIWGHAYEMDYETENWVKLENLFRLLSGHNDIFYGTNSEILL